MLVGVEGWVRGLLAQSLAFVGLAVVGFFWRLSFDAPLAVCLRPRLSPFSNSLAFFYRHIKHNVSIVLSFYLFFDL